MPCGELGSFFSCNCKWKDLPTHSLNSGRDHDQPECSFRSTTIINIIIIIISIIINKVIIISTIITIPRDSAPHACRSGSSVRSMMERRNRVQRQLHHIPTRSKTTTEIKELSSCEDARACSVFRTQQWNCQCGREYTACVCR